MGVDLKVKVTSQQGVGRSSVHCVSGKSSAQTRLADYTVVQGQLPLWDDMPLGVAGGGERSMGLESHQFSILPLLAFQIFNRQLVRGKIPSTYQLTQHSQLELQQKSSQRNWSSELYFPKEENPCLEPQIPKGQPNGLNSPRHTMTRHLHKNKTPRKGKLRETESRFMAAQGWG